MFFLSFREVVWFIKISRFGVRVLGLVDFFFVGLGFGGILIGIFMVSIDLVIKCMSN